MCLNVDGESSARMRGFWWILLVKSASWIRTIWFNLVAILTSLPVSRNDKMAAKDLLTPYLRKMRSVLSYRGGWPSGPTKLFDFLYLAGEDEATNLELLQKLGITHVINCAASYVNTGNAFYGNAIEKYVAFEAEDDDSYNIMQHFEESYAAIEEARQRGGKALIHCIMGINRSGALAVTYAMVHKQWGPIKAAEYVKNARKLLLSNDGFQYQIVSFAQERNLLELDSSLLSS